MLCPGCDHDNLPGADLCSDCGMDLAGLDVAAWGVDAGDPLLKRTLGDLPLKSPLVLEAGSSVLQAVRLMRERHEGCVFVVDDQHQPVGVFTERDVAVRVAARGRDPQATTLDDVMTRQPVCLERDDPFAWALHRMGVDGFRHLPVTERGRLSGFLSARTVLEVLLES